MQVCEQHFLSNEVLRTASGFDEKSGKTITCSLKIPKLSYGAIPSIFPNCSACSSQSSTTERSSRKKLYVIKECKNIKTIVEKSEKEFEEEIAKDRCRSFVELTENLKVKPPWQVVELSNRLNVCYIEDSLNAGPHIKAALCIGKDMLLDVFIHSVKFPKIGKFELPAKIVTLSQIYEICKTVCCLKFFFSTK